MRAAGIRNLISLWLSGWGTVRLASRFPSCLAFTKAFLKKEVGYERRRSIETHSVSSQL